MKILAIDNNSGSRFYRIIPQLKWMQKHGHEVRMITPSDQQLEAHVAWSDIVVFQMVFSKETVRDVKKLGKPMIFECDDLLHTVPKTHYSYEETKGWKKLKWLWDIWRVVGQCDGFISTSKHLNFIYGWMARKSLVFPNYLELEHWLKEPKKNMNKNRIRILWAGSTSHTGDLIWFKPIIKAIMDRYPQVQFVYIGMGGSPSDDLYTQFVYGEDFFTELPKNRRESVLPVPANIWPYILASLQADIAVAPLEKNYFNKHKSQCKFLEYSINAIPGVYSGWHYTDVINGHTGFKADTHEEWIEKLSLLIENDILRTDMGERAKKDVLENHVTSQHLHKWQKFVEDIYNSKGKKIESLNP